MHPLREGLIHVIEEQEFDSLIHGIGPLRIKAGFDPTAPDLHLGHAVLLKKLRQFQDAGHTVVLIVGDTTASIGDPTGRNSARPPLSDQQIEENAATYTAQAYKILDRKRTIIRHNSSWLKFKPLHEVVDLCSTFTVQQMLQRDDFRKRFEANQPIHLHELMYPLMQAYDSYWEAIDIELGGTDQLFNLMVGREYMKLRGSKPQVIATVPLLVGLDGVQKMSKSLGNHIGLTEEPFFMFSKIMSISDDLADCWWPTFFAIDVREFKLIPPMRRKLDLAHKIVEWLHSKDEADKAEQEFRRVFSERGKPTNMEHRVVEIGNRLDKLLAHVGLATSVAQAGRLIKSGAVEVNGEKAIDHHISFTDAEVKVGRRWMRISQG